MPVLYYRGSTPFGVVVVGCSLRYFMRTFNCSLMARVIRVGVRCAIVVAQHIGLIGSTFVPRVSSLGIMFVTGFFPRFGG